MKKKILKTLLCLFAMAVVATEYSAFGQDHKGITRSIIINNGDTTVNGKKFRELNKDEQAKLREEFKEMDKNFRGSSAIRSEGNNVVIRRFGSDKEGVVPGRNEKEPNVLYWNDNIDDKVGSFGFNIDRPRAFNMLKHNGDSMLFDKDFQVFSFGGDSSMSFKFNADSLIKSFNFKMDGLDSNLRKRVITMHRDMVTGRPGGMTLRVDGPAFEIERRAFPGMMERNNSSLFNYNHTDKDGISSRMSIRIGDANKDQLKKIIGAETIIKTLEVSDLTLFPNFSSGKMTISFNVTSNGTAKVSVLDSDLKSIFTDETANFSGNYVKQLTLPKNGVYYVTVSQNGNWFVKRLVKE